MNPKRLSVVFIFFLACACQQKDPALTDATKMAVIKQVEQALNNYVAAVKKDGLTAEFEYLDNSLDFFWVPPGYSSAISYDSIAVILNANALVFQSVENSFDSLRVVPLTEELATYTAQLRSVITDTSGNRSSMRLIETGIVIKRTDGWKLLSGQTSLLKDK
jgi:hypothetical protein